MNTLKRLRPSDINSSARAAVDAQTLNDANVIVTEVRNGGDIALRRWAEKYDRLDGPDIMVDRARLEQALKRITPEQRALLERVATRIRRFAEAQKDALTEFSLAIPGGRAGHRLSPIERAACYAPGGGYPLPSSVLMTAITARVAGVRDVWVASPNPSDITLAAAAVAGADGLLAAGGAHAIAAFAYGTETVPAVDVIVGPGNRWVTAAKKIVMGQVGIDMLAGPSELAVLADDSADPTIIAADLLAQAEHAADAMPILVTTSERIIESVDDALRSQLAKLPTREPASTALANGFAVLCADLDEAIASCDQLAAEHLQIHTRDPQNVCERLQHYGALFVGTAAGEVLGDYGAGPNHVLPTGGTARFSGGLSVFNFLRVRTWIEIDDPAAMHQLARDAAALARLEGLEAHARAAEQRCAD